MQEELAVVMDEVEVGVYEVLVVADDEEHTEEMGVLDLLLAERLMVLDLLQQISDLGEVPHDLAILGE